MKQGSCDLDNVLSLSTDLLKLEGTMHVAPVQSVKAINPDTLAGYLSSRDVRSSAFDQDALELLCEKVIGAPLESHEMVVARGTPAINGDSVTFTLEDSIKKRLEELRLRKESLCESPELTSLTPDECSGSEAVNYYDQMAFLVVQVGDIIAMRSERSDGVDGSDIFGKIIPAHEGKKNEGVLDDSISVDRDGTCFASIPGVLTATPAHISVSKHLDIDSDVDFNTGRIVFPGSVRVHGAVRDHFGINADGDVHIQGLTEVAVLESRSNITLDRGMAGKETGSIRADGNLAAGYLEGVLGHIIGDVHVRGEITNSTIEINGELIADGAAVRGGELIVAGGAQIGSLGASAGVETILAVGSLPGAQGEIMQIDLYQEQIASEITAQFKKIEQFAAAIKRPTAAQIEEQMGMQFVIDELNMRSEQLDQAKRRLSMLFARITKPRLEIKKAIYPKSVVYLPGHRVEFPRELIGESVIEIHETGRPSITYRGQTVDLNEHARVEPDPRILRVSADEASESTTDSLAA